MTNSVRQCSKCNEHKPLDLFGKGRSDGYHVWCKPCLSSYAKARWAANPNRDYHYLAKYNMTKNDAVALLQSQNNKCAICEIDLEFKQGFRNSAHVDHCHETGVVRGILCGNCNTALGKLGDSIESIKKVLNYLEKSDATSVARD